MPPVDVEAIRGAHSIEEVVAASGVELRPTGRGFMCSCPFHVEDRRPSMSVGGVPGRFHCFACGARGDVIDYVARFNGLGFREAADWLTGGTPFRGIAPLPVRLPQRREVEGPDLNRTPRDRILAINQAAWEFFTTGPRLTAAERYLTDQRHIDVAAIRSIDNRPIVGLASASLSKLSDHLQALGFTVNQIIDADLARPHCGQLWDTYRARVVVPARDALDNIEGFLGRTVGDRPDVPKYRNPTTTATFDKSRSLYRPTRHRLDADGFVVVVEGVMDALALTAAAASSDQLGKIAPITASGLSVSHVQALKVLTLTSNPVTLAFDGDEAGRTGAGRWTDMLCRQLGRDVVVLPMAEGVDPSDWLAREGARGLDLFSLPASDVAIHALCDWRSCDATTSHR